MDLLQNPFYILGATLRDNKKKIFELAEEKSLYVDSVLIAKAQADLTNPRKRLNAELAWLPGVGPKLASELLSKLMGYVDVGENQLNNLSPLAKVNFYVSRFNQRQFADSADWTFLGFEILAIAEMFESIDIQDLSDSLNADRIAAGFPEINDEMLIEGELHERRRYIRQVIKETLNNVPSKEILEIMKLTVEESTDFGNKHGFIIIDDLVDGYEIEVQEFLQTEGNNIESLIISIRESLAMGSPKPHVEKLISQLIAIIKNWQLVAEPIQINTKSHGSEHRKSHEVAMSVRSLCIDMYNNYNQIELSARLIENVKTIFTNVTTVAELINEDIIAIGEIAEKSQAKETAFEQDITYETSVGKIFTDRLKISPQGIEWKESTWTLDTITRIRWGGVRRSVNGIPTGTTYSVYFGSETNFTGINLSKSQYNKFVDCLWKAVGVNILTNTLKGLQSGKQYVFGTTEINDEGIVLEKYNFFSANEKDTFVGVNWSYGMTLGAFVLVQKTKSSERHSHILIMTIFIFWKLLFVRSGRTIVPN